MAKSMSPHPQRNNTGQAERATYQYPGLGLPLRYNPQHDYGYYPNSASLHGSESELIFVRELAMMDVMDKLTDKPDWHKKVFDDAIVEKWEKEALAIPDDILYSLATTGKARWGDGNDGIDSKPEGILGRAAFEYCIKELRAKATYFEETGVIPTLDACASIAKSDSLIDMNLQQALCKALDQLKADHEASPDWHPNTNDMVQDLVHPSMYPLVYGRTRAFQEECVGVEDAVKLWAGKGAILEKDDPETALERERESNGYGFISQNSWSETYQWLPANVELQQDGRVKIMSYINNLHPNKYTCIYRTLEKLIEQSLPLWDQCLALVSTDGNKVGAGRRATRMPKDYAPDDEERENWIPDNQEECEDMDVSQEALDRVGWTEAFYDAEELPEYKWKAVRKARLPELPPFNDDIDYAPREGERLVERFHESGLQIIVKIASVELTPDKPDFPVGGWHVEGQMNEYICATALYYLDSENVTSSSLTFRMQTPEEVNEEEGFQVGQSAYHWLEAVYGTELGGGSQAPCVQNYGNVSTRQGRLLAFPNVFQHRVSPFKLVDPTKPGHRRFIALWLVDPTKRVVSTANIPPQQMSWYIESLLGTSPETRKEALTKLPTELVNLLESKGISEASGSDGENPRLPEELMEMVRKYFDAESDAMPMTLEEAREHRANLMRERSAFQEKPDHGWENHRYNFCEH